MNDFNKLWNDTISMVHFEINRIKSTEKVLKRKKIEDFYKHNIIVNLWFSEVFPNKYNKCMQMLVKGDNSKYTQANQIMSSFTLKRKRYKTIQFAICIFISVILCVVGVANTVIDGLDVYMYILAFLFFIMAVRVLYTSQLCSITHVDNELIRVKNEMLKLLEL